MVTAARSITFTERSLLRRPLSLLALALISSLIAAAALPTMTLTASAKPFVWARAGDAQTLDPHAFNEGMTLTLSHQIYEPLLIRDNTGKVQPALATSWTQSIDPLVWVFTLRSGVTFHDGQPLTVDDVIFSLNRALRPTSDLRTRLQGVKSFRAVGPDRIEITTESRDPLLPIRLTDIFVMSKSWAEANGVTEPQNILANDETFATNNTNGTGPYKLVSREPGKLTRLVRNDNYWGWNSEELPNRIEEIEYRPIPDDKERITELLQKSVDFVQDVPLSELVVLRQAPAMFMKIGPENRVIFLGLSTQATFAEKPNILADIRVREAISIAVDRRAIQRDIMLGQSIPTGVLAPPGINGFPSELDEIPPRDLDKARALLKAAGIAPDARVTLDCPTNRYVNDAAICQAVARQLGEIGILVTLGLSPKADHFQNLRAGRLQFYLLGWGVPTFDSAYIFTNLFHTRSEKFGTWNGTGYSNADLDKRIEALPQLNEPGARARSMNEIWRDAAAARTYVPIHVQTLIYAMREGVNIDVDISNTPKMKHATVKPPTPN